MIFGDLLQSSAAPYRHMRLHVALKAKNAEFFELQWTMEERGHHGIGNFCLINLELLQIGTGIGKFSI